MLTKTWFKVITQAILVFKKLFPGAITEFIFNWNMQLKQMMHSMSIK